MVEWRISIYGKSLDEWDKLSAWVVENKLFSSNVRWLIQIPRLFDIYSASNLMNSFDQALMNIFQPLFEVTGNPKSHPNLYVFLQRVIGFDSVDDESKMERRLFKKFPVPKDWTSKQNPPYSYWMYYLFANMASLNHWRKKRGFNTFLLRPHCGEAGDSDHLAAATLCCHSISHGLLLRKVPLLQYVFYLEKIGIAMSPLSNNALFLAYERNPFHQYFKRGLNVSLSTDDPLQFAFTKEPLIEEYAVAAQIYKLSPVDMCELAKNSVRQSGFENSIKKLWLGDNFELLGRDGNEMVKTNVPDIREDFRHNLWLEEWQMLRRHLTPPVLNPTLQNDGKASTAAGSRASLKQVGVREEGSVSTEVPKKTGLYGVLEDRAEPQGAGTNNIARMQADSVLESSIMASPQALLSSKELAWTTDACVRESTPGVPQHEPMIFPGLMSRRARADSLRRESMHGADSAEEAYTNQMPL